MVVCGQTLRQVVAQLELELLRPCQYKYLILTLCHQTHMTEVVAGQTVQHHVACANNIYL